MEQEIYLELIITTSCSKENYVTYIRKKLLLFNSDILPIKQHFLHLKKLPDCVFSDKKSCIHDSRNEKLGAKVIFEHNNISDLENKLKINKSKSKVIVFESVYSMDGNFSPINEICNLAEKYNALAFLDEVLQWVCMEKEVQVFRRQRSRTK